MGDILFLCHRIPYPPNKGDKIRAYHWLRALAAHHRVHLGTFVDDPADWSHREALDGLCAEQCYRPLPGLRAKARSLNGLWRGEALSFGYYRDRAMTRWVRRVLGQHPIDAVFVFSSTMAPYALDAGSDVRRVLDFVDVDSDKWHQYAGSSRLPMRWVYAREAKRLFQGERALAARFDASVFVSEAEADFFRRAAPEVAGRVHALGNGVDADYFDPGLGYDNPYGNETGSQLVFTGAMDYGANADAMVWFVEAVLPRIRETRPEARLSIVGTRPTARVRALASHPGVQVTGAVPDVRPYLAHADAAIAPMRIARGIQNKVLEALAMGRPTVMTEQAAAGLVPAPAQVAPVAGTAAGFASAVVEILGHETDRAETAGRARDYVLRHYGWEARFAELRSLVGAGESAEAAIPGAAAGLSA